MIWESIIQLQHHSIKAFTKVLPWFSLQDWAGFPSRGVSLSSGHNISPPTYHKTTNLKIRIIFEGKPAGLSVSDICWSRSDFTHSIPAPHQNHDTCKDLKANPLSNMHAECGSSLTSFHTTLIIYDREKGHVCSLQYVIHKIPLRRCVQGMGTPVQTVAGQNLYWSIQQYYLQHMCTMWSGLGSAPFQFNHLRR